MKNTDQRIGWMVHPFWIINSSLFCLLFFLFGLMLRIQVSVPTREPLQPVVHAKQPKKETLQINISKIYENDLFDTYVKEQPPEVPPSYVTPFPEPPTPQEAIVPEIPTPQFLDPLDITLKGIIVFGSNNPKNRTIIADNKTNQEAVYMVNDILEDAQVIRILNNKVILLRSNGQQEVLYLREEDAKSDPAYLMHQDWNTVIKALTQQKYVINISEFVHRIENLGQFIDLLGLTTAYKQGKSIGCIVGTLAEKSLGIALGLQENDIISSVNGIPAISTDDRLKIYKEVTALKPKDTIKVVITRNHQELTFEYLLQEEYKKAEDQKITTNLQKKEKEKLLKEKYKFAPTLEEIRKREKQNIQKGQSKSVQSPLTE